MCRRYVIAELHCSFSTANLQLLFAGIETENVVNKWYVFQTIIDKLTESIGTINTSIEMGLCVCVCGAHVLSMQLYVWVRWQRNWFNWDYAPLICAESKLYGWLFNWYRSTWKCKLKCTAHEFQLDVPVACWKGTRRGRVLGPTDGTLHIRKHLTAFSCRLKQMRTNAKNRVKEVSKMPHFVPNRTFE